MQYTYAVMFLACYFTAENSCGIPRANLDSLYIYTTLRNARSKCSQGDYRSKSIVSRVVRKPSPGLIHEEKINIIWKQHLLKTRTRSIQTLLRWYTFKEITARRVWVLKTLRTRWSHRGLDLRVERFPQWSSEGLGEQCRFLWFPLQEAGCVS